MNESFIWQKMLTLCKFFHFLFYWLQAVRQVPLYLHSYLAKKIHGSQTENKLLYIISLIFTINNSNSQQMDMRTILIQETIDSNKANQCQLHRKEYIILVLLFKSSWH